MSNQSFKGISFLNRARIRLSTAPARVPSPMIFSAVCRALFQIGRTCGKPLDAGVPVGYYGGKGLLDFMRDRGGEFTHAQDPGKMGQLGLCLHQGGGAVGYAMFQFVAYVFERFFSLLFGGVPTMAQITKAARYDPAVALTEKE